MPHAHQQPTTNYMDLLILVPTSVIVFALGSSIGSFINVVVYRLPVPIA
jgi:leader peptidase (prepilin peptidase) / N-methyltransferase